MKTGVAKEVVERMMIAEAKHLYPRRREGRAFVVEDRALLGSTYSYHLVTKKTGAAQSSVGDRPPATREGGEC